MMTTQTTPEGTKGGEAALVPGPPVTGPGPAAVTMTWQQPGRRMQSVTGRRAGNPHNLLSQQTRHVLKVSVSA